MNDICPRSIFSITTTYARVYSYNVKYTLLYHSVISLIRVTRKCISGRDLVFYINTRGFRKGFGTYDSSFVKILGMHDVLGSYGT